MFDYNKLIADYAQAKASSEGVSSVIIGDVMKGLFQKGNVDLLDRPVVSGIYMNDMGWTDVDDDEYATVYTLWYARGNDGESAMWTDDVIIHVTPIRANGQVETPMHLDEYIDRLIANCNSADNLLAADDPENGGKGLIICVQHVQNGWARAKEEAEVFDIALHQLQAAYYLNDPSELPEAEDLETIADWFHLFDIYIQNYKNGNNYITDETLVYSIPFAPGDENIFISPKVTGEMGKAGAFEFGLQVGHPYYNSLCQMKTLFRVVYDGDTIFRGRVLTIDTSHMTGDLKVHCEGDLAFLLDSQIEGVSDNDRPKTTAINYMVDIIGQHNAQVDSFKRFELGEVPGQYTSVTKTTQKVNPDSNYRYGSGSWRDSQSAWNDLTNSFGGFLRTRYQNGTCFIDWLDQYYRLDINPQVVEVGTNVVDLTSNSEVNNIFTVVIPVGSKDGKNLYINGYQTNVHGNNNCIRVPDICSVFSDAQLNQGFHRKEDYQNAINDYGYIYHTESFSNAETQAQLWEYATDWIKNNYIGGLNSFSVGALDMHLVGESDGKFLVGDKVRLRYPDVKHRSEDPEAILEKTLTMMKITYDLHSPEKNTYNIGVPNAILKRNYGEKKNKKSRTTAASASSALADDEIRSQEEEIWKESREIFDEETIWSLILSKASEDPAYEQYAQKYGDDALAAVLAVPEAILYNAQLEGGFGDQARKVISGVISGKDHTIELKGPVNQAVLQETGKLADALILDGLNHGVTIYQEPFPNATAYEVMHPSAAVELQAWFDRVTSSSGSNLKLSTTKTNSLTGQAENLISTAIDGFVGSMTAAGFDLTSLNKVGDVIDKTAIPNLTATGSDSTIKGGTGTGFNFKITGQSGTDNKSSGFEFGKLSITQQQIEEFKATIKADGENGAQALHQQVFGGSLQESVDKLLDGRSNPTIKLSGETSTIEAGLGGNDTQSTVKITGQEGGKEWVGYDRTNNKWRIKLNDAITYTDNNNVQHTREPGFVTAEDFHISTVNTYQSLKTKLAVVDELVAGKITVADLTAFRTEIDQLYATKAEIEELVVDTFFSDTAYSGTLNVTNVLASGTISGGTVTGAIQTSAFTFIDGEDTDSLSTQLITINNQSLNQYVFGTGQINLPEIITSIGESSTADAANGTIGFSYTTASNGASHDVNFNIADTAYYKGRVGIKSASATSGDASDWQYWDEAVAFNGTDLLISSVYNLIEVLGNNTGETKNKYSIRVNASGVLSEENVKATQTYLNDVGIDMTATTVVSGNWRDWSEDWDIPSAQQKTLSDQYGKVTVTANDGTTYVFGIDASDVYDAGVREGEGNIDVDAAYKQGYITAYGIAQSSARSMAFVDSVDDTGTVSYDNVNKKLQVEVTATSKMKYKKLQNDSTEPESDWDSNTVAGTPMTEVVELPMIISDVELYKTWESKTVNGKVVNYFEVKSDAGTGWVKIGDHTQDVPLKSFLEIPISAGIRVANNESTNFYWHTEAGDNQYKYTFTTTGYVNSNNDVLYDLKQEGNVLNPTYAIDHGKGLMGVSTTWVEDNKVEFKVAEGGTKDKITIEVTAAEPTITYNDKTHEYTVVSSAKIGDSIVHNSAGKGTGTEAYVQGLTEGQGQSQVIKGEITGIDYYDNDGDQYTYNKSSNKYSLYIRASGRNLENTNNYKDTTLELTATEAFNEGRIKGRTEVEPEIIKGEITTVDFYDNEGEQYTYNKSSNTYSLYISASGRNLENTNNRKDVTLSLTASEAYTEGRASVKVSSASAVVNDDTGFNKNAETARGSMIVTLDNGYTTILDPVVFDNVYQAGLHGDPEISTQEFEFEFVDENGNPITISDPNYDNDHYNVTDGILEIYQRGVRDASTIVNYGYADIYGNSQSTYKRVMFYKTPGNSTTAWGYLTYDSPYGYTEVKLLSSETVKSGSYQYYYVEFDGFVGYIASGFVHNIHMVSSPHGGWYKDNKPTAKITDISIYAVKHNGYAYEDSILIHAATQKGHTSMVDYYSYAVYDYSSIPVTSGITISEYLKELTSYTGFYAEHSTFKYNTSLPHKVTLKVTTDVGVEKVEYITVEISSKNITPQRKSYSITGLYHRESVYNDQLIVTNISQNSYPMDYYEFEDLSITSGESIGSYISGSFYHSSNKYSSSLYHKIKMNVVYDFNETKTVVIGFESAAKTPQRTSFTVQGVYHSDSVYSGSIYINGINETSQAQRYLIYDATDVTPGESYSSYFSASNTHSSFKYASQMNHKMSIRVNYEFNEYKNIVIGFSSGAKKPDISGIAIVEAYNSSNLGIAISFNDRLGYARTVTCKSSGYANIDTTSGEVALTYFTGAASYAYKSTYPSSMTCKIVMNVTYSDGTVVNGVVVSLAANRDAKPDPQLVSEDLTSVDVVRLMYNKEASSYASITELYVKYVTVFGKSNTIKCYGQTVSELNSSTYARTTGYNSADYLDVNRCTHSSSYYSGSVSIRARLRLNYTQTYDDGSTKTSSKMVNVQFTSPAA